MKVNLFLWLLGFSMVPLSGTQKQKVLGCRSFFFSCTSVLTSTRRRSRRFQGSPSKLHQKNSSPEKPTLKNEVNYDAELESTCPQNEDTNCSKNVSPINNPEAYCRCSTNHHTSIIQWLILIDSSSAEMVGDPTPPPVIDFVFFVTKMLPLS